MGKRKAPRATAAASRRRGIGCLFWVCLAAILVAVGFAARAPLQDAMGRLFGGKLEGKEGGNAAPLVTVTPLPPSGAQDSGKELPAAREHGGTLERTGTVTKPLVRKTRLFFVAVDPAGKIDVKGVIRTIQASDSPLRDTIGTLLKGPTSQEINLGLLTMIPADSKLRGVSVRGDTAYIDFSESFRFNALGIEGLEAQLRQVVYAATEFPTVKKVQILIEGKRVRYLGTEGVRVDEPLARSSFQG